MIIEFFGFPGSGKTTISNEVIKELENQNYSVIRGTFDHKSSISRICLKFLYSLGCFFVEPSFFIYNVRFFWSSQGKKGIKDLLNITYLYARYNIYKNSKKLIVFDQGLAQAYFSVLSFNPNYKKYHYVDIVEKADKIIVLNLSKEQIKKRIQQRKTRKSRIETAANISFSFIEKQFEHIKGILTRNGSTINLININAEKEVLTNTRYIISNLTE